MGPLSLPLGPCGSIITGTWLTLAFVAMTYPPTTRMPRLEKGLVSHSHCEGEGHGVYWLRGMMRLRGGAKPAPTWLGRIHVKIPEGYTKDSLWMTVKNIVLNIRNDPMASSFSQPVDAVALKIPHYTQIVKEPMDLGTILKRLEERTYAEPKQVKADVELVWRNCRLFNPKGSWITNAATSLNKVFAKEWKTQKIDALWFTLRRMNNETTFRNKTGTTTSTKKLQYSRFNKTLPKPKPKPKHKWTMEQLDEISVNTRDGIKIFQRALECLNILFEYPMAWSLRGVIPTDLFRERYKKDPTALDLVAVKSRIQVTIRQKPDLPTGTPRPKPFRNIAEVDAMVRTILKNAQSVRSMLPVENGSVDASLSLDPKVYLQFAGNWPENSAGLGLVNHWERSGKILQKAWKDLWKESSVESAWDSLRKLCNERTNDQEIIDKVWRSVEACLLATCRGPDSAMFRNPVDYATLGLWNYPKIITKPMDLNSVLNKTRARGYKDVDDVLQDVDLVFANCERFNGLNHSVSRLGRQVQRTLMERWSKFKVAEDWDSVIIPNRTLKRLPHLGLTLPTWTVADTQKHITQASQDLRKEPIWKKLGEIVVILAKYPSALPFASAVPTAVPGYHAVVEHPMDFKTIFDKIKKLSYSNPWEVDRDVRQIFMNAKMFNNPSSALYKTASTLEASWDDLWNGSNVTSEWNSIDKTSGGGHRLPTFGDENLLQESPNNFQKISESNGWRVTAAEIVRRVIIRPEAPAFNAPVSPSLLTYHRMIRDPMDLVWENSYKFNPPGSPLAAATENLQNLTEILWRSAGFQNATERIKPQATQTLKGRKRAGQTQFTMPDETLQWKLEEGWEKECSEIVQKLSVFPDAATFIEPVPIHTPRYYDVIKYPMDLGTIKIKLKAKPNSTDDSPLNRPIQDPGEFRDLMDLVWENCRKFNIRTSPVYQMGERMRREWGRLWRESNFNQRYGPCHRTIVGTQGLVGSLSYLTGVKPGEENWTYTEKIRLAKRILRLDNDAAGNLVSLIAPHCANQPEYQMDLDALSPSELLKIKFFLDNNQPFHEEEAPQSDDDPRLDYYREGGPTSSPKVSGIEEAWALIRDWIKDLRKKKRAGPFNQPVSGVPGYYEIIDRPMDLQTLEDRLNAGYYRTEPGVNNTLTREGVDGLENFAEDFRQIFDNCAMFNPKGAWIRSWGDTIRLMFQQWWVGCGIDAFIKRELDTSEKSKTRGKNKRDTDKEEVRKMKEEMELLRNQLDHMKHKIKTEQKTKPQDDMIEGFFRVPGIHATIDDLRPSQDKISLTDEQRADPEQRIKFLEEYDETHDPPRRVPIATNEWWETFEKIFSESLKPQNENDEDFFRTINNDLNTQKRTSLTWMLHLIRTRQIKFSAYFDVGDAMDTMWNKVANRASFLRSHWGAKRLRKAQRDFKRLWKENKMFERFFKLPLEHEFKGLNEGPELEYPEGSPSLPPTMFSSTPPTPARSLTRLKQVSELFDEYCEENESDCAEAIARSNATGLKALVPDDQF
ncbi:hypothetical protein AAMO2058_000802500 [Amorphochlora amoebiformis]